MRADRHNRDNPYWWGLAFAAAVIFVGFLVYSAAPEMEANFNNDLVISRDAAKQRRTIID